MEVILCEECRFYVERKGKSAFSHLLLDNDMTGYCELMSTRAHGDILRPFHTGSRAMSSPDPASDTLVDTVVEVAEDFGCTQGLPIIEDDIDEEKSP